MESEKVMKKNMIAFRIPKFITSESKLNFPLFTKSLIDKTRRTTPETTKISFINISVKDSKGEKNNFKMNNAPEIRSSS